MIMDLEQWTVEATDFFRYRYNGERFFENYPKVRYRAFTKWINGRELLIQIEVKIKGMGSTEWFYYDIAGDCFYKDQQITDRNLNKILGMVYSTFEKKIQYQEFTLPYANANYVLLR